MFIIAVPGALKQLTNAYLGTGRDNTLDNPPVINETGYLVGERSVVVLGR